MNWDPVLGTAVSDLEVESEEEDGTLWHIRYPLGDDGDAARIDGGDHAARDHAGRRRVAVHPDDERYKHLIGKLRRRCR